MWYSKTLLYSAFSLLWLIVAMPTAKLYGSTPKAVSYTHLTLPTILLV